MQSHWLALASGIAIGLQFIFNKSAFTLSVNGFHQIVFAILSEQCSPNTLLAHGEKSVAEKDQQTITRKSLLHNKWAECRRLIYMQSVHQLEMALELLVTSHRQWAD